MIPKKVLKGIVNISTESVVEIFNILDKARVWGLNRDNKIIMGRVSFRFDGVNLFEDLVHGFHTFQIEPTNIEIQFSHIRTSVLAMLKNLAWNYLQR